MKLALLGYGKMGKAIEQEALQRGHEIVARFDLENLPQLKELKPEDCDLIIEFTHPDSFFPNLNEVLDLGIPMVSGTTGWYDRMEEVKERVAEKEATFLYSSNFSVGVNILFLLNKRLAELMNRYPEYDVFIEEQHHKYKADAPSGTAVSLSKQILEGIDRKNTIATDALLNRPPKDNELSVGYIRAGEIIGRHKISYTSDIDEITLEHKAHNRRGFALGAVIAAEWLVGKKGFYSFEEVFA
ncbi:MAG: 4-hydroxy-tetrahydrodipicolinate reductase [Bacteroidota bacterium]